MYVMVFIKTDIAHTMGDFTKFMSNLGKGVLRRCQVASLLLEVNFKCYLMFPQS